MSMLLGYFAGFLTNVVIYTLFVIGLNLQFGYTGLINFGHVAFLAVGAYTVAILVTHHAPILLAVLAGMAVAALFSFLLGYPALRLRDDYLAIVTIGFAEVLRIWLNNVSFTNGPEGIGGFAVPLSWLPVSHDAWRWLFLLLCAAVTAVVFAAVEYLARSPWGRVLKAIREDEDVAVALGKNIVSYKLAALALGAAIAGLAGGLTAFFYQYINPHNFEATITFEAWTIMVLGGVGKNWGAVLGAVIYFGLYTITSEFTSSPIGPFSTDQLAALRIVLIGVVLILLMIYRPQGILGRKEDLGLDR
ncbi:MAG: branched-chain amino acid ABC transporter permease [Firmicutes bacterium]|nr:branched-chain amino acid ABC transporter permease [Bacillota bacterium]